MSNPLAGVGPSPQWAERAKEAAMPARYAIERSDWKQVMALESRPSQFPFMTALT